MFVLNSSKSFDRKFKKIVKKNSLLKNLTINALKLLRKDPFSDNLKTHKVNAITGKGVWSSRVNEDIRIIWDFSSNDNKKKIIILLLDLGGHSGKNKVYK